MQIGWILFFSTLVAISLGIGCEMWGKYKDKKDFDAIGKIINGKNNKIGE